MRTGLRIECVSSDIRHYFTDGYFYRFLLLFLGSIFLRKKIDTQKEVSHETSNSCGRHGEDYADDNFYLFSPPDFTLVGDVIFRWNCRMKESEKGVPIELKPLLEAYCCFHPLGFVLSMCVFCFVCFKSTCTAFRLLSVFLLINVVAFCKTALFIWSSEVRNFCFYMIISIKKHNLILFLINYFYLF